MKGYVPVGPRGLVGPKNQIGRMLQGERIVFWRTDVCLDGYQLARGVSAVPDVDMGDLCRRGCAESHNLFLLVTDEVGSKKTFSDFNFGNDPRERSGVAWIALDFILDVKG